MRMRTWTWTRTGSAARKKVDKSRFKTFTRSEGVKIIQDIFEPWRGFFSPFILHHFDSISVLSYAMQKIFHSVHYIAFSKTSDTFLVWMVFSSTQLNSHLSDSDGMLAKQSKAWHDHRVFLSSRRHRPTPTLCEWCHQRQQQQQHHHRWSSMVSAFRHPPSLPLDPHVRRTTAQRPSFLALKPMSSVRQFSTGILRLWKWRGRNGNGTPKRGGCAYPSASASGRGRKAFMQKKREGEEEKRQICIQ